MKAVIYERYGGPDVLRLADVADLAPRPGEVVVKVKAAGLNRADCYMMTGSPFPLRFMTGLVAPRARELPFVGVGADFAGEVIALGEDVSSLAVGDRVFGQLNGETKEQALLTFGTAAERVRLSAENAVPIPDGVSFQDAAALPMAGMTALQAIRRAGLTPVDKRKRVLVVGASGGVGTFCVQIAKRYGSHVTAVCSGRNEELVRSLGADRVVDYTKRDVTLLGDLFDVVLDCVGDRSVVAWRRLLTSRGTYVAIAGEPMQMLMCTVLDLFVRQSLRTFVSTRNNDDLAELIEMVAKGEMSPHIEKVYPLAESVEAMRHLATRRARGKLLIAP